MDAVCRHLLRLSVLALLVGIVLSVSAFRAEAAQLINATNSSRAWSFSDSPDAIDGTPVQYNDCPLREPKTNFFMCATEFFYQRPDGTDGSRWFFTSGYVQRTGVHVNPFGPGEVGTPHSYSSGPQYSWIRYWHGESPRCLRSWRVHGAIQSNFPCAAYEIWHGVATEGFGDGQRAWPWLYHYSCSRRADWTTCQNALGDAYRYRGAYPSIWGSRSGSTPSEAARPCNNHAGRLEGDGQYSDGAIQFAVGISCDRALAIVKPRYRSLPGVTGTFALGSFRCYATLTGPVDLIVCVHGSRRFEFI